MSLTEVLKDQTKIRSSKSIIEEKLQSGEEDYRDLQEEWKKWKRQKEKAESRDASRDTMQYIIQIFDQEQQTFWNYDDYKKKEDAIKRVRSMVQNWDGDARIRIVQREIHTILAPTHLSKIDEKI